MTDQPFGAPPHRRRVTWPIVAAGLAVVSLVGFGAALASGPDDTQVAAQPEVTESPTTTDRPTTTTTTTTTTVAPEAVEVPALELLPWRDARAELTSLGLTTQVERQEVGSIEYAFVIDHVATQDPAPGSVVEPGSTVVINVGSRPSPATEDRGDQRPQGDWVDLSNVSTVGHCGNEVPDARGTRFVRVDCGQPHDVELVDTVLIEAPGELDTDVVFDSLLTECLRSLDEYVGLESTALNLYWIWPGEDGWANGERIGYCYAQAPNWRREQLVGSAKDSMW